MAALLGLDDERPSRTTRGDVGGLTLFALDPVALGVIAAVILVIAFVAGTLPAARAARKDPIEALRYE